MIYGWRNSTHGRACVIVRYVSHKALSHLIISFQITVNLLLMRSFLALLRWVEELFTATPTHHERTSSSSSASYPYPTMWGRHNMLSSSILFYQLSYPGSLLLFSCHLSHNPSTFSIFEYDDINGIAYFGTPTPDCLLLFYSVSGNESMGHLQLFPLRLKKTVLPAYPKLLQARSYKVTRHNNIKAPSSELSNQVFL
jgi:hypothetical protein